MTSDADRPRLVRLASRRQRTLARPVAVSGRGMITGASTKITFYPAEEDTGRVLVRDDLPGSPRIPANAAQVADTSRRTTLGAGAAQVTLVEHALAALAGLRIDNCLIELDGPEPPGLDGSAAAFVRAIWGAGVSLQSAARPVWGVSAPVTVREGVSTLTLHPAGPGEVGLTATYFLDYGPLAPLPPMRTTAGVGPADFASRVAPARTFLLESEVAAFHRAGVGRHLTEADLLVYGPRGPVANRLRFADEPCRHKILDLVGDLALTGADWAGRLVAHRSGHPLNVALARTLTGMLARTPLAGARRVA